MNIKEQAKQFAIKAHQGQVRKNEPDKPMIVHPLSVGRLLEDYRYPDYLIAAAYLHDVVEDTSYTITDITDTFGPRIAELVAAATEPDKKLPWEQRKQHTIDTIKTLPLESRLIICADKIDNLEDLLLKFQKESHRDFSNFKRGEEAQKWYYTNVYEALITDQDENLPLFKRLKFLLNSVFNYQEDSYLKDVIFSQQPTYYQKLNQLHAQKLELYKLRQLLHQPKPFVIEFSGTPRTGKTSLINNLADFFKKGGFQVSIIEEFTTSKYYKEVLKPQFKTMSSEELMIAIITAVEDQLVTSLNTNQDIILIDRSLNDRQIWNYRNYLRGTMSQETYFSLRDQYLQLSKETINFLVISYADALVSLKRDYQTSLALEPRSFLTKENIEEYNNSLLGIQDLFEESTDQNCFVDTTTITIQETSTTVAEQLLPQIRQYYLQELKKQYQLKKIPKTS